MSRTPTLPLFDQQGNPLHGKERDLARKKLWNKNNPEMVRAMKKKEFLKHREKYRDYCKEYCKKNREALKEKTAKWKIANPERKMDWYWNTWEQRRDSDRRRAREWASNNKDRVAAHRIVTKGRRKARIASRCDNLDSVELYILETRSSDSVFCFYCGVPIYGPEIHMDHIEALANGGRHSVANMTPSCPLCNLTKNRRKLSDWFGKRPLFYEI